MRILVTGGSGFIGSWVVDEALERGHEVAVLDLRPPRRDVPYVKADVREPGELPPGDAVVHLAAVSVSGECRKDPIRCFEVNVLGTTRILGAAARAGYSLFALGSTEWLYALSPEEEVDEDTPLSLPPEDPYIASKLMAEQALWSTCPILGIGCLSIRIGNPIGPGEREGLLHREVIRRILSGEEVVVHGRGEQRRQYLHVSDLARGIVLALEKGMTGILNLSGPEPVTVMQVIESVSELLGRKPKIRFVEGRRGYPGKRVSIERAKSMGWEPMPYREALRRYLSELGVLGRPRSRSSLS